MSLLTVHIDEIFELRSSKRDVGGRLIHRYYTMATGGTLEGSTLEEGQFLPDDGLALIISADIEQAPTRIKQHYQGQLAHVVGWRARTLSGQDSKTGFTELSRTRGVVRIGPELYEAERIWKGPNSTARIFADSRWDERYPEISGPFSPRVRRTKVDRDVWPGFSRVRALYKTIRDVGRANLLTRTRERPAGKLTSSIDAKGKLQIIDGPDPGGLFEWRPLGDNSLTTPFQEVVFQTAYRIGDFQLRTIFDLYNSLNDRNLPNFGNVRRGTLLMIGGDTPDYKLGDDIINVDLRFRWSGGPDWNSFLKAEPNMWVVQELQKFERANGAQPWVPIPNEFREVVGLIRRRVRKFPKNKDNNEMKDAPLVSIAKHKYKDYSTLNGMLL